jgi:hypothetical protein
LQLAVEAESSVRAQKNESDLVRSVRPSAAKRGSSAIENRSLHAAAAAAAVPHRRRNRASPVALFCAQELAALKPGETVYKLMGPMLVRQEQADARAVVDGRLEFLDKELCVGRRRC